MGGFTLIEAIMVITITGILAGMVAVFIRSGVTSYVDTARRAELTDSADTALRRISRDLRLAVPNTVRPGASGGVLFLEMLASKTGGRYDSAGADSCFTSAGCTNITTAGSVVESFSGTAGIPAGPGSGRYSIGGFNTTNDRIVIYNQYNNSGADCSTSNPSAYCGHNTSKLSAAPTDNAGADSFAFASTQFLPPGGSPSRRFQIVEGPVSYACNPTGGVVNGVPANSLVRYAGYAITAVQPVSAAAAPLGTAPSIGVIASNVSGCAFSYSAGVFERWGVVGLDLKLTQQGETVSLYHEVHINNVP